MEHPVLPHPQLEGFCPFPVRISPAAGCALALGLCLARIWLSPVLTCHFGHTWLGVSYTEGLGNASPAHLWGLAQALGKEELRRPRG